MTQNNEIPICDYNDTTPVGQVNRLLHQVCNAPIYLDNVLKACEVTNDTLAQIVIKPVKISRRMPDGSYNNKPLDPEYFKKYWQEKLTIHVECPRCGKFTGKGKMFRHFKSASCIKKTLALTEKKD